MGLAGVHSPAVEARTFVMGSHFDTTVFGRCSPILMPA